MKKRLNAEKSSAIMQEWINSNYTLNELRENLPELDENYSQLRNELLNADEYAKKRKNNDYEHDSRTDYIYDVCFGRYIYEKLNLTIRDASDDDFWRYLSIKVIPDIVAKRWGIDNADHFWKKSSRIWLKNLWWYVHMSYNESDPDEDLDTTEEMLLNEKFNTDTILNLVERTGRTGTYIEVYRKIIFFYSCLTERQFNQFNRRNKNDTLFRSVMKLNTVRSLVIDPLLSENGADGYVKKLYNTILNQEYF